MHVSKQVPSDYSGGQCDHGHTSTWLPVFKVFDSRPKTRTARLLCEAKAKAKDFASEAKAKAKDLESEAKAKAKDYSFKAKAKAKDTISWPRGSSRPRPRPRGLHLWHRPTDGLGDRSVTWALALTERRANEPKPFAWQCIRWSKLGLERHAAGQSNLGHFSHSRIMADINNKQ